ncbi:hypothetical protein N9I50_00325 [bacterium]|nr:hypothetical protein [bacterium]
MTIHDSLKGLTPTMEIAIDLLAAGATATAAAAAAEVTRQTVSGWKNRHPGFQAALNLRRVELIAERADRIRELDARTLEVIADKVADGDAEAAMMWVRARHLHRVDVTQVGPIDAEVIFDAEANGVQIRSGSLIDVLLDNQHNMTRSDARAAVEAELLVEFSLGDQEA